MNKSPLVEWSWVYTVGRGGYRLHPLIEYDSKAFEEMCEGEGVTSCGIRGRFAIPGLFSRMGMPRCSRCCDALGWPRGNGSPKNDDMLRPLMEALLTSGADPMSAPRYSREDRAPTQAEPEGRKP